MGDRRLLGDAVLPHGNPRAATVLSSRAQGRCWEAGQPSRGAERGAGGWCGAARADGDSGAAAACVRGGPRAACA